MNFGEAIELLKRGSVVCREGWNGKGMFIWLNKGSTASPDLFVGGVSYTMFEQGDTGTATRMPNINMRAADGSTVTGWLASQTDILADDWQSATINT